MATDYPNLVPRAMAADLLQTARLQSAALQLGRTRTLPAGLTNIPLVSFLPVAGFVNPMYGGTKPATKVEWNVQQIQAEELAAVLAIPNAFIDDAGFPVWDEVRTDLANAMAIALDRAVFKGTGAPASFPAGGIVAAAGTAVTGTDAADAIDKAAAAVEASLGIPSGIVGGPSINTGLRQVERSLLIPPVNAPTRMLYGWPVAVTPIWDTADGDALVGDFNYLLVGIREDITFDTSQEAVLQDGTGDIIANTFQQDLTAMRVYMRVGVAIGHPINPLGGTYQPFALADWTP